MKATTIDTSDSRSVKVKERGTDARANIKNKDPGEVTTEVPGLDKVDATHDRVGNNTITG